MPLLFFYSNADTGTLVHWITHTPPQKSIYNSLEWMSVVSYILDKKFMMKYGSYEKYISICSQSFLCCGWNCIKIEPLQDQCAFLPACLCWLHENHTVVGREELKVVDGVLILDFLWQWDKEGHRLCLNQCFLPMTSAEQRLCCVIFWLENSFLCLENSNSWPYQCAGHEVFWKYMTSFLWEDS